MNIFFVICDVENKWGDIVTEPVGFYSTSDGVRSAMKNTEEKQLKKNKDIIYMRFKVFIGSDDDEKPFEVYRKYAKFYKNEEAERGQYGSLEQWIDVETGEIKRKMSK